jgi:hypothetical protein
MTFGLLTGNQAISFFSSLRSCVSEVSTEPLCCCHPGFFVGTARRPAGDRLAGGYGIVV